MNHSEDGCVVGCGLLIFLPFLFFLCAYSAHCGWSQYVP